MTNVRCKGGKEIDLLAMDPRSGELYHIESRVSTTFKLRGKATYTKDGRCHKNGLDYLNKEKFEHPDVKDTIKELFRNRDYVDYRKVLVVWDFDAGVIDIAEKQYGIQVLDLGGMIEDMMYRKLTSGSRDDVLRLMELVYLYKKLKKRRYAKVRAEIIKKFGADVTSFHANKTKNKVQGLRSLEQNRGEKVLFNPDSPEPKVQVFLPSYLPLKTETCSKCGHVIAQQKELIRIVQKF